MSPKLNFRSPSLGGGGGIFQNQHANKYDIISSGGYYGTSTGGYTFAYPGQPFTVYGSVHFAF